MNFVFRCFYSFSISAILLALVACSNDSNSPASEQTFSVSANSTSITFAPNETRQVSYDINQREVFDVGVTISESPVGASLNLDTDAQIVTLVAGNTATSGNFVLNFASSTEQHNLTFSFSIEVEEEPPVDSCTESCEPEPSQDYLIYLPSDYVTIFEDEEIAIELKRNYSIADDINESFYFNSHNISGRLSDDKQRLIVKALQGEEDTYGEIKAVTEVDGVTQESRMYILYLNKNRDLTSAESPQIAVIDSNVQLTPFQSTTLNFDIYDPDSDRMSYRIVSAPSWLETHVNKVAQGYDLTFYPVNTPDWTSNEVVLQISDGHNVSDLTFTLTEQADNTIMNMRPALSIENNVAVSLLREMSNVENGETVQVAFAASDNEGEHIELNAESSSDNYQLRLDYPFLYLTVVDTSLIEHDQVTINAHDGSSESKLTFHIYTKDNYTDFLGGNPNLAPLIQAPDSLTILESKFDEITFEAKDPESHDFTTGIEFDDNYVQAIQFGQEIAIDTLLLQGNTDVSSVLTIWAEDVFGSRREHEVNLTIAKNQAPVITISAEEVVLVEGFSQTIDLAISDPEGSEISTHFDFENTLMVLEQTDSQLSIRALQVSNDYLGDIVVLAEDEFGALSQATIAISIENLDPFNEPPTLAVSQNDFELHPGGSGTAILDISDPEGDTLTTTVTSNDGNLTYSLDTVTGELNFIVSPDSPWEREYQLHIVVEETTQIGSRTVEDIITVIVPEQPVPPELSVDNYVNSVNEKSNIIINFQVSDANGDDVTMSLSNVPDALDVNLNADNVEINVPQNVNVATDFEFLLVATDSNDLTDSELINFSVQPVNDVPDVTLAETSITLTNDTIFNLGLTISDPDSSAHTVEVRSADGSNLSSDFIVHTTSSTNIAISGASKGTIVNNETLLVRVYDPVEGLPVFTEVQLVVSVILENEAPDLSDNNVDQTQIFEGQNQVITITPIDPDGDNVEVLSVTSQDEAVLTVIQDDPLVVDQSLIKLTAGDVDENTQVMVEVELSDGFTTVVKLIVVEILNSP